MKPEVTIFSSFSHIWRRGECKKLSHPQQQCNFRNRTAAAATSFLSSQILKWSPPPTEPLLTHRYQMVGPNPLLQICTQMIQGPLPPLEVSKSQGWRGQINVVT